MIKCTACDDLIWFWQKTKANTKVGYAGEKQYWHRCCWTSWENGYRRALNFCTEVNRANKLPEPMELYHRIQLRYEVSKFMH